MATKAKLPSTAVGRRRLLKGAALLEADAKDRRGIKFDFGVIGYIYDREKPMSCGTVGCALGLFGVSGAFKKQGLSFRIDRVGGIDLKFGGTRNTFKCAERFFDLSAEEAEFLFASSYGLPASLVGAKTERAVAKRIRQFVAGKVTPEMARSVE